MFRRSPALCASLALASACANILGLSDYEVDPALDPADDGAPGGANASGGTDSGVEGGQPGGGLAGQAQGGSAGSASGGDTTIGGAAGEPSAGGQAGASTGPDCDSALDCDDDIPCTADRCDAQDGCVNAPDGSLCAAGPGECFACQVNVGCVARAFTSVELLEDKDFDLVTGAWEEYSDTWTYTIFAFSDADTPPNYAEFGDSDGGLARDHGYMTQLVTIPQGTQALTFSGVYQLWPGGTARDIDDSIWVRLNAGATQNEVKLFNVWNGTQAAQTYWQSFSYEATRSELTSVLGKQAQLEFETYSWATLFDFDTVSLEASVCPQN